MQMAEIKDQLVSSLSAEFLDPYADQLRQEEGNIAVIENDYDDINTRYDLFSHCHLFPSP